jgi:hypothetical protein
MLYVDLTILE